MLSNFTQMDLHVIFMESFYKIEWSWVNLQSSTVNHILSTELLHQLTVQILPIFSRWQWKLGNQCLLKNTANSTISSTDLEKTSRNEASSLLSGIIHTFAISYFSIMVGQNHETDLYPIRNAQASSYMSSKIVPLCLK